MRLSALVRIRAPHDHRSVDLADRTWLGAPDQAGVGEGREWCWMRAKGSGRCAERLQGQGGMSITSACDEPPPPLLLEGVAQFNRGEYFAQHETLETLWRAEPRRTRELYQGILQIGVAFHHLRRDNYHGVVYMLTRGSMYLGPFAPRCQSVDVAGLLEAAAVALSAVEALGPGRLREFDWALAPRVILVGDANPGAQLS